MSGCRKAPIAVLSEHGRRPELIVRADPDEPATEKVAIELLLNCRSERVRIRSHWRQVKSVPCLASQSPAGLDGCAETAMPNPAPPMSTLVSQRRVKPSIDINQKARLALSFENIYTSEPIVDW
jgi:hypothetical protein